MDDGRRAIRTEIWMCLHEATGPQRVIRVQGMIDLDDADNLLGIEVLDFVAQARGEIGRDLMWPKSVEGAVPRARYDKAVDALGVTLRTGHSRKSVRCPIDVVVAEGKPVALLIEMELDREADLPGHGE